MLFPMCESTLKLVIISFRDLHEVKTIRIRGGVPLDAKHPNRNTVGWQ
jgi:hypothetical protein